MLETVQALIGEKFAPLTIMSNEDTDKDSLITTFNTTVTETDSEILGKHRQKNKKKRKKKKRKEETKNKHHSSDLQPTHTLTEKYLQDQQDLCHVFIDFKKVFDRVRLATFWATMMKYQPYPSN